MISALWGPVIGPVEMSWSCNRGRFRWDIRNRISTERMLRR